MGGGDGTAVTLASPGTSCHLSGTPQAAQTCLPHVLASSCQPQSPEGLHSQPLLRSCLFLCSPQSFLSSLLTLTCLFLCSFSMGSKRQEEVKGPQGQEGEPGRTGAGRTERSVSPTSGRQLAAMPGSHEKAITEEGDLHSGSVYGGQGGARKPQTCSRVNVPALQVAGVARSRSFSALGGSLSSML